MKFTVRLKNKLKNLSLKTKLYLICYVFSGILFLSCSAIGLNAVLFVEQNLLYQSIHSNLQASSGMIAGYLDDVLGMTDLMIADETVQNAFSEIYRSGTASYRQPHTLALQTSLKSYYSLYKKHSLKYISFYTRYSVLHTDILEGSKIPRQVRQAITEIAQQKKGSPYWCTEYTDTHGLILAREIRETGNLSLRNLGEVHVCIDIDELVRKATDYSSRFAPCSYMIFDGANPVFISPELAGIDHSIFPMPLDSKFEVIEMDGSSYFAVRGEIPGYDWQYICLMSYDKTADTLRTSYASYLLVIAIVLLVSLALTSLMVNRMILRHLDRLIRKMQNFHGTGARPYSPDPDYSDRTDELGILHREFDNMATEINTLIRENYENEILMKDAQIKALEMQINPHFLYNTLETVNWRAKAIGEKQISMMVEALGMLLRKTLSSKGETNTLADELEILRHYMTITNLRFEDRLDYICEADPAIMDAQLPKLTLQPLVENAVHYALEEVLDVCQVRVTAHREGDLIIIRVRNNGSQFEDDLLEKLRNQSIMPKGLGIGILNIDSRIQLSFGEEYGLSFYNEEDEYAVAEITIPYRPLSQ